MYVHSIETYFLIEFYLDILNSVNPLMDQTEYGSAVKNQKMLRDGR